MFNFIVIILVVVAVMVVMLRKKDTFTPETDAYVINLKRRPDRLELFMKHYYNSDISRHNLVVVEAIDGKDLEQIQGFIPESTKKILTTGKRESHDELTPGMIGCYLSHYKVYEKFLESGKASAFIFEDDGEIAPSFLVEELNNLPEGWDIVMFGVQSCMDCPNIDDKFNRLHNFYGAGGYIINRQGAIKMIQNKETPIIHQIDLLIAKLCREQKINVYSLKNNLVNTAPMGSDVQMGLS